MHLSKRRFSFCFSGLFNPTLVLLGLIFLCSLYVEKTPPKSNIQIISVNTSGQRRVVTFNPKIDLTSQFNFNVKMVFLYARVNYKTGSQEMIWSRIVQRKDRKVIDELCRSFYDIRGEVGKEVEIELRGSITPFVGLIRDFSYGSIKYVI